MIPETYDPLVRRLIARTAAGEVNWKPTPSNTTFAVHFGEFSLTVDREEDFEDRREYVVFELLNENGDRIDSFSVGEGEQDWSDATDLHDRARRKAIRVDEAISAIMSKLDQPQAVGEDTPKRKPDYSDFEGETDDDLPF